MKNMPYPPETAKVFIKDNATEEDIRRLVKYLDDQAKAEEEINKPLDPDTPQWIATEEQRKVIIEKMTELHTICQEANIPMLFIAQVAQDPDGPTMDTCMVGATDRVSIILAMVKSIWMMMFDGNDIVRQFDRAELRNFIANIEHLFMTRLTTNGEAEAAKADKRHKNS